jgi:succinyl-CoA synthetase beta subunit
VVVDGPAEAAQVAAAMLGQVLVTRQTGPAGRQVRHVLVEEAMRLAREHYLAIVVDRGLACPVVVACAEGGMDIEEVAARRPEAILKVPVEPRAGYSSWIGRRVAYGIGLKGQEATQAAALVAAAYRTFVDLDASLVEINPLAIVDDGRVLALDAKLNFDDTRSTGAPRSASCGTRPRRTRSRSRPARSGSTTSGSTATWGAWSTALGSRWPRWTRSSTTEGAPRTSSMSAAARPPRW